MKLALKIKAKGTKDEISALHPGFQKVAEMISKKTGSNGAAILANSSRNASPKAKKKNPRLMMVK
jgi:hypothetical protein